MTLTVLPEWWVDWKNNRPRCRCNGCADTLDLSDGTVAVDHWSDVAILMALCLGSLLVGFVMGHNIFRLVSLW